MDKPTVNDILTMIEEKQIVEINNLDSYCSKLSLVYVADGLYTYEEAEQLVKKMNKMNFLEHSNWRLPTELQLRELEEYNRTDRNWNLQLGKNVIKFKGIVNCDELDYYVWSKSEIFKWQCFTTIHYHCVNFGDNDEISVDMSKDEKCMVFLVV